MNYIISLVPKGLCSQGLERVDGADPLVTAIFIVEKTWDQFKTSTVCGKSF